MKKIVNLCTKGARLLGCLALASSSILCAESSWARQHELDRLLQQTLKQNPAVLSASSEAQAASEDVDVARWQRWPTLSASAEMVDGDEEGVLALKQPLWTAGALTARIRSTEATSQAADLEVEVVRKQLAIRMLNLWQALVSAHYSLERQENSLLVYNRYQEMMQHRVEAQVSPGVDLELLQTRKMQAQTEADDSRVLERVSRAQLEQLAGFRFSETQVNGLLEPLPPETLRSWASASMMERFLKNVTEYTPVRKALLDAEAAHHGQKLAEAEQWPQLSTRYQSEIDDESSSNQFVVGFTYTPGAGLSSRAQARAQSARAEGLARTADVVAQDLLESLRVDWENLRRNLSLLDIQADVVRSSREVLESYERQFVTGRKSWLDVLNSLRELTHNEVSLVESRAGAAASYYRLRWRSDELPPNTTSEPKEMQSP